MPQPRGGGIMSGYFSIESFEEEETKKSTSIYQSLKQSNWVCQLSQNSQKSKGFLFSQNKKLLDFAKEISNHLPSKKIVIDILAVKECPRQKKMET